MGATEEQSDSPKVRSRWALVTWGSLIDSISTDAALKKDPSSRRPTSIWTLAGMAAISALFIYMAQTSVISPRKSATTVTGPDGSKDGGLHGVNVPTGDVIDVNEQAIMISGRKMALQDLSSPPSTVTLSLEVQDLGSPDTALLESSQQARLTQKLDVGGNSQVILEEAAPDKNVSPGENAPVDTSVAQGGDQSATKPLGKPGSGRAESEKLSDVSVSGEATSGKPGDEQSSTETSQKQRNEQASIAAPAAISSAGKRVDAAVPKKDLVPTAHVFISTDERDLRPIFVVINSTLSNAKNRDKVDFNLVMPQENEAAARQKLLPLFPGVKIEINRGEIDAARIQRMITYKEGTGARRELVSVFNFIPFYLPFISRDLDRIVYLDADVVVVGDIGELAKVDMEGKAAAAVEDCMQMFKTYFDFKQLAKIQASKDSTKPWMPHFQYDKKTCVFNRGVLLIDVQLWIKENMTETIEWWMKKFQESKEPLYKFGLSQPPFLLALYQRYKKLDRCWNTRGLGRDAFGEKERDFLARIGFGRPPKSPFLSPWADTAKIMHFNGKYKPWRLPRTRRNGEKPKALCGESMADCAEHWWKYMSDETHRSLTPTAEDAAADAAKPE